VKEHLIVPTVRRVIILQLKGVVAASHVPPVSIRHRVHLDVAAAPLDMAQMLDQVIAPCALLAPFQLGALLV